MKKLNVIDLDGTLIPFDSFALYYKIFLKRVRYTPELFTAGLLRKGRLISRAGFARWVLNATSNDPDIEEVYKKIIQRMHASINVKVMDSIRAQIADDTVTIICSASPDAYVKRFARELGWEGQGSYFDQEGNFRHLYGVGKINYLHETYPPGQYHYHFSISDSESDIGLLAIFEHKILHKND